MSLLFVCLSLYNSRMTRLRVTKFSWISDRTDGNVHGIMVIKNELIEQGSHPEQDFVFQF